jgi:hypothetical protein
LAFCFHGYITSGPRKHLVELNSKAMVKLCCPVMSLQVACRVQRHTHTQQKLTERERDPIIYIYIYIYVRSTAYNNIPLSLLVFWTPADIFCLYIMSHKSVDIKMLGHLYKRRKRFESPRPSSFDRTLTESLFK